VRLVSAVCLASVVSACATKQATVAPPREAPRVVVIVLDGLRPDDISPARTPTLARLRARGVAFTNTHAAFPTVTRVNGAVLTTGNYPSRTGIVGNTLYVPAVDSLAPFSTGDDQALERLRRRSGELLNTPSLGERLQAAGLRYTVVTSGSGGNALLLNPMGPGGVGVTINPNLAGGTRVSWADSVDRKVRMRFGKAPSEASMLKTTGNFGPVVRWADRVLREYVLSELKPDVLMYWITEPDETQHQHGVGSREATAALLEADAAVGRLVAALDSAGSRTNYLIVSDHGFTQHTVAVPVSNELIRAGLKRDSASTDVTVVSDAETIHLFVRNHGPETTRALAALFQRQATTAAIFARDSTIAGTFPLAVAQLDHPERGADLVVTLTWRADTNAYGVPGTQAISVPGDERRVVNGAAGHGGLSPYVVHATMLAVGPAFRSGRVLDTPVGNIDVTPTVLALLGLPTAGTDGRVLREAFVDGPPPASLSARADTLTTSIATRDGVYRSALLIMTVEGTRYIGPAWRLP
jgi:arylsulfatase A-like enzyme